MGIWGLMNRRFEAGSVRSNYRGRQDSLRSRSRRALRIEQFEERTLLSIGVWEPLGPAPVNYANSQVENVAPWDTDDAYLNQVVGSISAVAAHPTNADVLYVGTTNGGIWRTDNATDELPTWTQLTDDAESLSIGALAFDPTDPTGQTLIAGVGRFSEYNRAGGVLGGLMKTTNGGETWTALDGDGLLDGKNCISIAIRGETILVAVDNAESGSYDDVGIFRSEDGGETFTQISDGDGYETGLPGGIAYDLAADPYDADVFYTAVVGGNLFGGRNGIYKSTNAGLTWIKISSIQIDNLLDTSGDNTTHRVQLSVGSAGQLYVGIVNQMTDSETLDELAAIFRTGDGGTTWTKMDTPQVTVEGELQSIRFDRVLTEAGDGLGVLPSGQGAVHFSIVADPLHPNVVYIGCGVQPSVGEDSPIGAETPSGLLFRGDASAAAGQQWVHLTHSADGSTGGTASGSAPHSDSRDMAFDAAGRLIEVDDGGIYVRTSPRDNTGDWSSLNGNLQIAEIYDVAYDSTSNVAIAGAQDLGVVEQSESGGLTWSEVAGGDGGSVAVDEASLADLNQSYRYSAGAFLSDFTLRTIGADNGVLATAHPALHVLGTSSQTFYTIDEGQYYTPIAVNLADPSRIIIGGSTSVFESLDRGETIRNLRTAANAKAIVYGGYLDGEANEEVLWVVAEDGVYLRTDAGEDLELIVTGTVLDIAVDPTDWRNAYIVTDNGIWQISVAAGTITNITGDYAGAAGLRTVEYFDSGDNGAVIVGGRQGVYYSEIGSLGAWNTLGEELPNATVYDMEYDAQDNVLVVGTLGRGVWALEDPRTEIFGALELVSVSTNTTTYQASESPTIDVSPTELVLRFNDPTIDPETLGGILIIRAGENGTFYHPETNPYDTDDVVVEPGSIGLGDNPNEVVIRFAETLPDDIYHVTIVGQGEDGIHLYYGPDGRLVEPFTTTAGMTIGFDEITPDEGGSYWDGQNFHWTFDLNLGPQVTGVVPQPITRDPYDNSLIQARDQIEVYFSEAMNPESAQNTDYYCLIATQETATVEDDEIFHPTEAVYDAEAMKVTLTFAADLAELVTDPGKSATGSFRLRIGDEYQPIVTSERSDVTDDWFTDFGSTFEDSFTLGNFAASSGESWLISGVISALYYDVQWPGGQNTPGNRSLPEGALDVASESHTSPGEDGDVGQYGEIPTYYYNFQSVYGTIQETPALNLISGAQKERVREIFSLVSQYCGVQFVETADQGMTIATGDLRVFDPDIEFSDEMPLGMATGDPLNALVVVNSYFDWGDSEYGSDYMRVAMHEILHPLGLTHSYELSGFNIMGGSETADSMETDEEVTFPGNDDIASLQYLYRNDSIDADYYQFELEAEGELSVETVAQRLQDSSLLDTYLVLYDENYQIIASNDDYFDDDSYISLHLEPGTYYIGVSSTGNSQYGPDVDGGTTEGQYQLRMNFQPVVDEQLTDARGTPLDGDADGRIGGHYDFWFVVQTEDNTIFVDKSADAGGDGSLDSPYKNVDDALAHASSGDVVRVVGNNFANDNGGNAIQAVAGNLLVDGQTFTISDANRTFTFELDSNNTFTKGNVQVSFKAADSATTVASSLAAAINSISWIPEGLSELSPDRHAEGLYARASRDGTVVSVDGPAVAIDLGSTKLKSSLQDNLAYEIGTSPLGGAELSDGRKLEVPQGVSLVIDAGAVFKLRNANISVGSSSVAIDRSLGSLQVLGTPESDVYFTSYLDERTGADTYANPTAPAAGNWGGLVFQNNYDYDEQAEDPSRIVLEQEGIFLNFVNHADIRYGGGTVTVSDVVGVYSPIHMFEARPTVSYSTIRYSADYAMSVDPNGLLETIFHEDFGETPFALDYDRVGPDLHGNRLVSNSRNALLLRVATAAGEALEQLDVSARFDDVDVVLAIPENLIITGDAGGAFSDDGLATIQARLAGRLAIDPGAIVKLAGARIEVGVGAQFIAEGAEGCEIIFTSLDDDTYGAGGTFDTSNNGGDQLPESGDWAGFYFHPTSTGSIDRAEIKYAGGSSAIEGGFGYFAPVEIRQATVRITNTLFENNTAQEAGNRNGRGEIDEPALIYVLFSQPVIAGNTFLNNDAPLVSIDVNSLSYLNVADWGRSTGESDAFAQYGDNQGPLVRENRMEGNAINGMIVRGGTLTTEGVWDDTDIVHVVYDEIVVPNLSTYGGLRLQSSTEASLVIKLDGADAGFTATGQPLEIDDRVGGTLQVIGTVGHPVVFTDLADDTVGAGLTPDGRAVLDTDNTPDSTGAAGAWAGIAFEQYSNDRNVAILNESEPAAEAADSNGGPDSAQYLGQLAAEDEGGDETLRLGFEVHGAIALDRPDDADVYSFNGYAGSEVWIQIDRTSFALDAVVELIDANGNVLARSDNWRDEVGDPNLLIGSALSLEGDDWGYEDVYSINPKDAGMRIVLPGPEGEQRTYYIRVSSAAPSGGLQTSGEYQLQVRLRDVYEHPGSTIRYAEIRYAVNGVEVIGLPGHSPLTADVVEIEEPVRDEGAEDPGSERLNDTLEEAQFIGNLLQSDQNEITVGGFLSAFDDVDWYKLDLGYGETIQRIPGVSTEGSVYPVTIDIDYADGLVRPDTTLWIFDKDGTLVYWGGDSNVADDQADPTKGTNLDDLGRGSVGTGDPFIGPIYLNEGQTYYVAVTGAGATAVATQDAAIKWESLDSIENVFEAYSNTFAAPGNTYGSITLKPFSLVGYSADDIPVLYFDYALESGAFESARVFASTDGVNWEVLGATLDNPYGNLADTGGEWVQVRIAQPDDPLQSDGGLPVYYYSLADFLGEEEVYLRFDFSIVGELSGTGAFLEAWAGEHIDDGDNFIVDGEQFTFDIGVALYMPDMAGDVIPDGETFTIVTDDDSDPLTPMVALKTFEFDYDGKVATGNEAIPIEAGQSATEVADMVAGVVNSLGLTNSFNETIYAGNISANGRLMLHGAEGVEQSADPTVATVGDGYGTYTGTPVNIDWSMSAEDVAAEIVAALEGVFATGTFEADGVVVHMTDHAVDASDPLPFTNYTYGTTLPGAFVKAQSGEHIEDGDQLFVDGQEFSFDAGTALYMPNAAGDAIVDGETFTVMADDGTGTLVALNTFEFDDNGMVAFGHKAISFEDGQSAAQVAENVAAAVNLLHLTNSFGQDIVADAQGGRVMLNKAEGVEQSADPTVTVVGDGYGAYDGTAIEITSMMSANQVADAIVATLQTAFGDVDGFQLQDSVVHMIGRQVDSSDALAFWNYEPNDAELGGLNPNVAGGASAGGGLLLNAVKVGFVERGEQAVDAPAGETGFEFNELDDVVKTGYYQLQIRSASEFAIWDSKDLVPYRKFDTNDRLCESVSLVALSAEYIGQGSELLISDGAHEVRFQFVDAGVSGVDPGSEPIYFSDGMTAAEVAEAIVEAINAAAAAGLFDVTAATDELSDRIDLFGATHVEADEDGGAEAVKHSELGDSNQVYDQGQLIIENSVIVYSSEAGILVSAAERDGDFVWPKPGPTAPLATVNTQHQVPGVVIRNNIVAFFGGAGIRLNGDVAEDGKSIGSTPIARIVNNTIYGGEIAIDGDDGYAGDMDATPSGDVYYIFDTWGGTYIDAEKVPPDDPDDTPPGTGDDFMCWAAAASNILEWTSWGFVAGEDFADADDIFDYFEDHWTDNGGSSLYAWQWWFTGEYAGPPGGSIVDVPGGGFFLDEDFADYHRYSTDSLVIMETIDQYLNDGYGTVLSLKESGGDGSHAVTVWGYDFVPQDPENPDDPWGYTGIFITDSDDDKLSSNAPDRLRYYQVAFSEEEQLWYILDYTPDSQWYLNEVFGLKKRVAREGKMGIAVYGGASATILNNVVADVEVGIYADWLSTSVVVGTTAYAYNDENTDGVSDTFPIYISDDEPLFVDAEAGNFYPAAGSRIIDSSLDALQERTNLTTVKSPLGLPLSPILAPTTDVLGQLRTDDPSVSPPSGMGDNTFKDRGAIDRVDFNGPVAVLVATPDNDAEGIDRNPTPFDSTVAVAGDHYYPEFIIHLEDDGAGIADYAVVSETVRIVQDDEELIEGEDYFFTYDQFNDNIILRSAGAAWASGSTYTIYLSDAVQDLAGTSVQLNHPDNTTSFVIELLGYDFGDAPTADTPLPDGARHIVDADVHLGEWIDAEATPQVNVPATADFHDDGVEFIDGAYVVSQDGETKTIVVTASTDGVLDAWIDWDQDGVWEAGEKLSFRDSTGTTVTTIAGGEDVENELTFDVPAGWADSGDFYTYVRFRFSTTGLLSDGVTPMQPTGEALDGEVEDYQIRVLSTRLDWGDAPDPSYPTSEDSNGAAHGISDDALCLGESVSFDPVALPNLAATGDDDNGFDFSEVSLIPGRSADLAFTVTNETGLDAYLNAWIDFNGDGDWNDAGEQIAADYLVSDGGNTLTIGVPIDAKVGYTYARFRLSTVTGLSYAGRAADGEVEDYRISILPVPGEIHGTKWNDLDENGIKGAAEEGLEGWTIYIDANDNGALDDGELSTVTAADGSYAFADLAPGEYIVREVQRDGWQQYGAEHHDVTVPSALIVYNVDFFNKDVAAPTVLSIELADPNPTNADTAAFIVTFSEAVKGVNEGDFLIVPDGVVGASISGIAGVDGDYVYTVTITTGLGDGALRLDLFNDGSILDLAGHALEDPAASETFEGEEYTTDRTPPSVASIELGGDSPTNAETVTYIVTFDEEATGVDKTDFQLLADGLTDAEILDVTGGGDVYTVTVDTGDGEGTLQVDLVDDDSILDLAGNKLGGVGPINGDFSGPTYEIDHTVPEVLSIVRAGASPTSDTTVYFTVTFSEAVTGVNVADFDPEITNLTGTTILSVTGADNVYTVTVKTGAGSLGALRLDLIDNDSIEDLAGNKLGGEGLENGDFEGETYDIDRTGPTGLFLSNDRVAEYAPVNTVVGALGSTGPHLGDYAYELVAGDGDGDNDLFRIAGGFLRTKYSFEYDHADPDQNVYHIRIRTTDSQGEWLEQMFEIEVVAEEDTASVGDLVWLDDGDGLWEAGEQGVPGAAVEIICSPAGVVGGADDYSYGQAVADEDGYYRFDLILPDLDYYLVFHAPVGYAFTDADVGGGANETIDSDADADGYSELFTLAAGEFNGDLDAGLVGQSEEYDFAIRAGAAGDDIGQSVVADSEGNAYVAGTFSGTVDFDPGVGVHNLTSAGGSDAFVAKYSSHGALIWVRAVGGAGDDAATGISLGPDNFVCISGSFSQTADFLSGPDKYELASAGEKDAFVMKLDSVGGLVWARAMGGVNEEVANDVTVGGDGSVYSTGYFISATADFDPGDDASEVYELARLGQKDVFISKLDADGNFVWAKRVGGIGWSQGMSAGMGIAVDAYDSVYTTGSFQGVADFDPGANQATLTCAGDTDLFLSKLNADGTFAWARRIGGEGEDYGADVATSAEGSVHVTGGFQGIVDFNPGTGTYNIDSAGSRRLFALKLTSAGNFVWAGGFGGSGWDLAGEIALDGAGNVYVSGGFYGLADFNPGADTYALDSAGTNDKDAFVLKLDANGGFLWALRAGGSGDDSANGVAVSSAGYVYATGYFHGAADFDPSAETYQLNSAGGRDAFLAKFADQEIELPLTVAINQAAGQADPASASPINFTVVFSAAVSDFTGSDVTLSGTAGASTATVTGSGTTYNVAVGGMTSDGTVIATIAAGVAHNGVGTANEAAIYSDNSVTYTAQSGDATAPTIRWVAVSAKQTFISWNVLDDG
ncbi:MAG: pre-peptidase C-terminal domain-containing protein, partial [Pirellulales bacterium]|nr:pre-peptidase C-terminal domain-containing protein [Pirellulales bacterium]